MNKVILIGNTTNDVEKTTTSTGISCARFGLAVKRKFPNGKGEYETDFFTVIAWRKTAEICAEHLEKGKKVCVVGYIVNRSYEAQDGSKRSVTEIIAEEVEFLSSKQNKEVSELVAEEEDLPF